ncbi:MAG: HAD hydrolase-like protein, partial [Pirellulales bacterium]|nr:HAD hydrolase-like protein [Pirellulales bacterium]
ACFFRVWDDEYLPAVNRGEREFESSFRQFLAAVGLKPAQIQEVEIAAIPRYEQLELSARPLPGVLPTLERLLSSGVQMAVQGDCTLSSSQLKAKLDGLGIGSFFSHCRTSIDMRATKSTSRCFEAVLADLELPAHDVAFVGRRHDDLAGAAACGLWTIAFNGEPDAEAEWHLPHFKDLTMLSAGPLARAA